MQTDPAQPGAGLRTARWRRRLLVIGAIWLVLTISGGVTIGGSWLIPFEARSDCGTVAKLWANFTTACQLPLWYARMKITAFPMYSMPANIVTAGIGWGFWALVALRVLSLGDRRFKRNIPVSKPPQPPVQSASDQSRRRFIAESIGGFAAFGGVGVGTLVTPWMLRVSKYTVPVRDLPRELDGLRIAQVSDTHLGAWVPLEHIRRSVQMALDLRPDLYVLTGDYVLMGEIFIEAGTRVFGPLAADTRAIGVAAVRGNHDHYWGAGRIASELQSMGIRVIDNTRVFIDRSRRMVAECPESGLCLAGLGDLMEDQIDVHAALAGVPESMPRLVLAHNPITAEVLPLRVQGDVPRIDLMLSGHMHGGQVRLPIIGAPWTAMQRHGEKYLHGLVQSPVGPVIISSGVGMSGVPVRIGAPPEVVEITLVRA